jgi:hypothetical protein
LIDLSRLDDVVVAVEMLKIFSKTALKSKVNALLIRM